jgi:hypothetical protein
MPGAWTWTDAWIFIAVFIGIRIAFIWIATKAFIAMIPEGDSCILCDGHTLPIERDGWWQVLGPRFRRSWCIECGWEGVLRRSDVPPPPSAGGRSGVSAKQYTHR